MDFNGILAMLPSEKRIEAWKIFMSLANLIMLKKKYDTNIPEHEYQQLRTAALQLDKIMEEHNFETYFNENLDKNEFLESIFSFLQKIRKQKRLDD